MQNSVKLEYTILGTNNSKEKLGDTDLVSAVGRAFELSNENPSHTFSIVEKMVSQEVVAMIHNDRLFIPEEQTEQEEIELVSETVYTKEVNEGCVGCDDCSCMPKPMNFEESLVELRKEFANIPRELHGTDIYYALIGKIYEAEQMIPVQTGMNECKTEVNYLGKDEFNYVCNKAKEYVEAKGAGLGDYVLALNLLKDYTGKFDRQMNQVIDQMAEEVRGFINKAVRNLVLECANIALYR